MKNIITLTINLNGRIKKNNKIKKGKIEKKLKNKK